MVGILGLYGLLVALNNSYIYKNAFFFFFFSGFCCEDSALAPEYPLKLEGMLEFKTKRLNFRRNDVY